jgi:hypothetical protein
LGRVFGFLAFGTGEIWVVQMYYFFLICLFPLFHIPCSLSSYSVTFVFLRTWLPWSRTRLTRMAGRHYMVRIVNLTSTVSKPLSGTGPVSVTLFGLRSSIA